MPGLLLRLMQLAQYVALVLSALDYNRSSFPIGTPESDAVDHVNPFVFLKSMGYI